MAIWETNYEHGAEKFVRFVTGNGNMPIKGPGGLSRSFSPARRT